MSKANTILLVDDDAAIVKSLSRFLEARGFQVMTAKEGSSALAIAQEARPALIVSDAEMPGLDGLKLCRLLKKDRRTAAIPIILISGAWTGERDQLSGFDGGAEDYVTKPISPKLLLARIQAVLNRSAGRDTAADVLAAEGVDLNLSSRSAHLDGKPLKLTRKEFDLLAEFLRKPDRVLAPAHLLESVWGYDPADYNDTHTVEVHLSSLRRKLGSKLGKRIVSVKGLGYKFELTGR